MNNDKTSDLNVCPQSMKEKETKFMEHVEQSEAQLLIWKKRQEENEREIDKLRRSISEKQMRLEKLSDKYTEKLKKRSDIAKLLNEQETLVNDVSSKKTEFETLINAAEGFFDELRSFEVPANRDKIEQVRETLRIAEFVVASFLKRDTETARVAGMRTMLVKLSREIQNTSDLLKNALGTNIEIVDASETEEKLLKVGVKFEMMQKTNQEILERRKEILEAKIVGKEDVEKKLNEVLAELESIGEVGDTREALTKALTKKAVVEEAIEALNRQWNDRDDENNRVLDDVRNLIESEGENFKIGQQNLEQLRKDYSDAKDAIADEREAGKKIADSIQKMREKINGLKWKIAEVSAKKKDEKVKVKTEKLPLSQRRRLFKSNGDL